jgi:prepilin-type N-terminal cleavage/methylation domain-containing protein
LTRILFSVLIIENMKLFSKSFRKGFTLIELLIVIAILGVLAAAVLIAINPAAKIQAAKDSTVKSDMGQLVNTLQAYFTGAGNQLYPANLAALVTANEIKSVPNQQSGALSCTGTAGANPQPYCYVVNAGSTAAAVWGGTYTTGTAYWCWDTGSGTYKSEAVWTTVPTVAAPTCP